MLSERAPLRSGPRHCGQSAAAHRVVRRFKATKQAVKEFGKDIKGGGDALWKLENKKYVLPRLLASERSSGPLRSLLGPTIRGRILSGDPCGIVEKRNSVNSHSAGPEDWFFGE